MANGIVNGVIGALKDIYKVKVKEIENSYGKEYQRRKKAIESRPECQQLTQKIEETQKVLEKLEEQRKKLFSGLEEYEWQFERRAKTHLEKRFAEIRAEIVGMQPEEVKPLLQRFVKEDVWKGV